MSQDSSLFPHPSAIDTSTLIHQERKTTDFAYYKCQELCTAEISGHNCFRYAPWGASVDA